MNAKLMDACKHGDIQKVMDYLQTGHDVDALVDDTYYLDETGCPTMVPLKTNLFVCAVILGHIGICELLVKYKADVNTSVGGYQPLYYAAANGDREMCVFLLNNGACVDSYRKKLGPLYAATKYGHLDICRLLLLHGAIIYGSGSLDEAVRSGHVAICRLLLQHEALCRIYTKDYPEKDHHLLIVASARGHEEICALLLNRGYYINYKSSKSTALHFAVDYEHPDVCRLLLEKGINYFIFDDDYYYAFEYADGDMMTCLLTYIKIL